MDKLFEIRADEIDIDQILQTIDNNIQKRYPGNQVDLVKQVENIKKMDNSIISNSQARIAEDDIKYLLNNYVIQNNSYHISSHRPIMGPILVKGRQMVLGEIRRYVDPMISKQSMFNNYLSNIVKFEHEQINDIDNEINKLKIGQSEMVSRIELTTIDNEINKLKIGQSEMVSRIELTAIDNEINKLKIGQSEMVSRIEQMDIEVSNMRNEIRKEVLEQFKTMISGMESEIKNKAWLLSLLENRIEKDVTAGSATNNIKDINYTVFSEEIGRAWNKISGDSVDHPNIFEDVVALFGNCSNIIDIGCGKGYLLQRLNASGIHCYGIDINEDYIQYCKRLGLEVINADALSHMRSLEDKSIDGIYIGHMIEHLPTNEIIELIKVCYSKLQYGSYLVILMPNIASMIVSTNLFFMDPTHINHVHPEVIKFLLKSVGFRDIKERLYQPVPEERLLKKIGPAIGSTQTNCPIEVDMLNENFEKLNNIIFGHRDYAVYAKR